jgi:hypothetical protein
MAKHDQRILKFLAQNSDRAPTITDMMTRLNISISEISASLSSLLAQGMIAKRTNNQGIECWFPAGNGVAAAAAPESRPAPDPRFMGGIVEKPSIPEPPPMVAPSYSAPAHHAAVAEMAQSSAPSAAQMPMQAQPPAKAGIGVFALLVGMAIAVTISAFLCNRLVERSVTHLSQGFVDMKVLNDAIGGMNTAQRSSNSQVRALDEQVKKLSEELAAFRAADSLKTAGAPKVEEKKAPPAPVAAEAAPAAPFKRRHHHGG